MRPIKFRGRDIDSGKSVCGDFVHVVPMSSFPGIIDCDGIVHDVAPDTIAQLVGYDSNGSEVYEGDTVFEEYLNGETHEHVARLESMSQNPENAQYFFWSYPAKFTTLKEEES